MMKNSSHTGTSIAADKMNYSAPDIPAKRWWLVDYRQGCYCTCHQQEEQHRVSGMYKT